MNPFSVFIAKPRSKEDFFLQHAPGFYRNYTKDEIHPLEKDPVVLKDNRVLTFLQEVAKRNNRNVILVSHATVRNGLALRLGGVPKDSKTRRTANWARMCLVLHLLMIRAAAAKGKGSSRPEDWLEAYRLATPRDLEFKSPKEAVASLRNLGRAPSPKFEAVRAHVAKVRASWEAKRKAATGSAAELKKLEDMEQTEMEGIIDQIESEITGRRRRYAQALMMPADDGGEIDQYLDALERVQAMKLEHVEVRGCNLGKDPALLEILALFLGARRVRSPSIRDTFAKVFVKVSSRYRAGSGKRRFTSIKRGTPEIHRKKSTIKKFGTLYELTDMRPEADQVHLAADGKRMSPLTAEHVDAVQHFLATRVGPYRGPVIADKSPVYLQFLERFPLIYPLDPGFKKFMKEVTLEGK